MSEEKKLTEKKIIIDEDWKSQVEAEKSAAEAARAAHEQGAPAAAAKSTTAPQSDAAPTTAAPTASAPMPPAELSTLVSLLATQAMVSLGALPNPLSHKVEADVAQAKHFVDLLEMLDAKTKGNTTPQEAQLLEGVLHELRLAYVQTPK